MIKTKEKRLICLIVLAISIVSLLTTLVSGLIGTVIEWCRNGYKWWHLSCPFILTHICVGVVFISLFFFNKKRNSLTNLIMLGIDALIFIVFCVLFVSLFDIDSRSTYGGITAYGVFSSNVAISISILVSVALMTVSKWLLAKIKEEEPKIDDNKEE